MYLLCQSWCSCGGVLGACVCVISDIDGSAVMLVCVLVALVNAAVVNLRQKAFMLRYCMWCQHGSHA